MEYDLIILIKTAAPPCRGHVVCVRETGGGIPPGWGVEQNAKLDTQSGRNPGGVVRLKQGPQGCSFLATLGWRILPVGAGTTYRAAA